MNQKFSPQLAIEAAIALLEAGRRDEAGKVAWEIIRRAPNCAEAWAMRAMLESEAGRYENALLHHGFALKAAPHRHDLWCNRGIDAMHARMPVEAEESFRKSLALQPSFHGHFNLGNLLVTQMRVEAAAAEYAAALDYEDEYNDQLHANYGEVLIALGEWREGFKHYRHRFNAQGFPPAPRLHYPTWKGEPLDGKTILLFSEQGFGDEILSLRFVASIKALGARVILAVRPPMYRLARAIGADDVIMLYDEPPWPPDFKCALLDVPGFVDMSPATVPLKGGYLTALDDVKLQWPEGLRVGICWASGKHYLQPHTLETAKQKSLQLRDFLPIARPGVTLVNLQQNHEEHATLRQIGAIDPMQGVTDFADTAFFISQLDLVITVDTAVAHLAGALGKPVWNLVRHDALWPWMREKDKTCWYDSMKLFRQDKPFDWSAPLRRLKEDFDALFAERNRGIAA